MQMPCERGLRFPSHADRAGTAPRPDGFQPGRLTWKRAAAYSITGLLFLALATWGFMTFIPAGQGSPQERKLLSVECVFRMELRPRIKSTISTSNLEVPPPESQYEAWLIQDDGEQRISLGVIAVHQPKSGLAGLYRSGGTEPGRKIQHGGDHQGARILTQAQIPPMMLLFREASRPGVSRSQASLFFLGATPGKIGFNGFGC